MTKYILFDVLKEETYLHNAQRINKFPFYLRSFLRTDNGCSSHGPLTHIFDSYASHRMAYLHSRYANGSLRVAVGHNNEARSAALACTTTDNNTATHSPFHISAALFRVLPPPNFPCLADVKRRLPNLLVTGVQTCATRCAEESNAYLIVRNNSAWNRIRINF